MRLVSMRPCDVGIMNNALRFLRSLLWEGEGAEGGMVRPLDDERSPYFFW